MTGDLHVPDEDVAERLDIAITDMWSGYDAALSSLIDGLVTAEARAHAKQRLDALRARSRAVFRELHDVIPQAERRGAIKALARIQAQYGDERAGDLTVRGNVQMAARDLADRIESGEVEA